MGLLDTINQKAMSFLPEDETKRAAALQGLMAAGLGMMQGSYNVGGRLAPAVGQGGLMGMQAYGGAIENAQEQAMRKFQMDQLMAKQKQQQQQQELIQKFSGQLPEDQRLAALAFPELAAKRMFAEPKERKTPEGMQFN